MQKRKHFDTLMHDEIDATVKDTGLNADGAKALEAAATTAEDAARGRLHDPMPAAVPGSVPQEHRVQPAMDCQAERRDPRRQFQRSAGKGGSLHRPARTTGLDGWPHAHPFPRTDRHPGKIRTERRNVFEKDDRRLSRQTVEKLRPQLENGGAGRMQRNRRRLGPAEGARRPDHRAGEKSDGCQHGSLAQRGEKSLAGRNESQQSPGVQKQEFLFSKQREGRS